jgi:hypothetical protein
MFLTCQIQPSAKTDAATSIVRDDLWLGSGDSEEAHQNRLLAQPIQNQL